MDGPAMMAACQVEEFHAMALAKSSRGTRLGISACPAGWPNALAAPAIHDEGVERPYLGEPEHRAREKAERGRGEQHVGDQKHDTALEPVCDRSGDEDEDERRQEGREPG
jgi:hypothetical protein